MKQMYETIIGIEVHVELNTKTKMFCRCLADYFGKKPNTSTCPVCLGLPGALPRINQEVIDKCIQIGLALNCRINERSYFERKNYFYPDLAKGFQTSQLVLPIAVEGWLDVEGDDGKTIRVRINRAHQEEDTGKLMHKGGSVEEGGDLNSPTSDLRAITYVDYNRSSVPLTEIVTEPDFTHSSQVKDYAKKLQQIFRYLGVSNADMERGDMRLEANVSVRPVGQKELPPYRVELKNINSFRFMQAAIEYEIKRQIEALEKGEKLTQETRGWNEAKKETYLQRSKEEAHDYRYFPEPDLPQMRLEESRIKSLESSMPELPAEKSKRFMKEYGLTKQQAWILVDSKELAEYFEKAVEIGRKYQVESIKVANFIVNNKIDIAKASPQEIISKIQSKSAGIISNQEELEKIAQEVIAENEKSVTDYKSGKLTAIQALIGGVMRKTQGKADAGKAREILENLLK
jgi:aspartyl-tRNA(Asn)/glutamyl-tRNA(Gln) amidotransferase subunit B